LLTRQELRAIEFHQVTMCDLDFHGQTRARTGKTDLSHLDKSDVIVTLAVPFGLDKMIV